ncbi:hypothetical protein BRADI_2g11016v3 [Brachypodium distachyon]|uniref:RanBP2-type domain-containing protein n=1 Tax=Brachypodium distachyon TaxID=15368 RepID=A0A0Q3FX00_BRADI|nr:hypothetical protein BRADI_2g11016v3 [Brachypodium distachyon]
MGISISRDRQGHVGWWLSSLLTAPVLLQYVSGDAGIPPPVTAALIAANVLAYFRPGPLDKHLPPLCRVIEVRFLLLGNDKAYYQQHYIGFSGVLFGMDVVLNDSVGEGPEMCAVFLCANLLLIQDLIPEASFIAHLGGILAGLTCLCWKRGPDPIIALVSNIADVMIASMIVSQLVGFALKLVRSAVVPRRRRRSSVGGGPVLCSAPRETNRGMWRCSICSFDNSQFEDVCERCSTPHEDHAFSCRRQTACQR